MYISCIVLHWEIDGKVSWVHSIGHYFDKNIWKNIFKKAISICIEFYDDYHLRL